MLRFISNLAGPIFAKEMVEVARRKRYYFNRLLYGAALLVAIAIVWQENYWLRNQQSVGQIEAMARVAQEIFIAICVVQYGAVFLLVPLFVAGLIAGERESNSLELLFTTSLLDREIVLGKLASRLSIMALLILCGVPVINLILLFGGVDPVAVFRTEMATLLAMLYAGSITIYFSSISKTPTTALVRSVWWMAVWLLGLPILSVMLVELFDISERDPAFVIVWGQAFINPIFLFAVSLEPSLHRQVSNYLGAWFFPCAFLPILGVCSVLLWRSVVRLRMPPTLFFKLANRWHPLAWLARQRQKRLSERDALRRLRAERLAGTIAVRNPLWLRARWTPVYDREGHIVRIQRLGCWAAALFLSMLPWGWSDWPPSKSVIMWPLSFLVATLASWLLLRKMKWSATAWQLAIWLNVAAVIAPCLIYPPRAWSDENLAVVFLVPTWIGVFVLTGILGSTSLVGDRRRGFLELVLISPLSPREILSGTVLAVMQHLTTAFLLVTAVTAWFCYFDAIPITAAAGSLLTGLLFSANILLLGTMCSLSAERTPQAVIPTVFVGAMFGVGLMFVTALFQELTVPLMLFVLSVGGLGFWFWSRHSSNPTAIAGLHFCLLLGLILVAAIFNSQNSLFSGGRGNADSVMFGTNPLGMIVGQIDDHWIDRYFRSGFLPCIWLAMSISLVLAWRWTIRNFDRIAGRTSEAGLQLARRMIPVVEILPAAANAGRIAAPLAPANLIAETPTETP